MYRSRGFFIAAAVATIAVAACSEDPASPASSALAGLSPGNSNDTTVGNPTPGTPTPGSFHGFVIGHGTGPDTIASAPRIVGATITAYPLLGYDGETPRVGDAVGSATTDANGFFEYATIPGGDYVVTIKPPVGSEYKGQYATTTISSVSSSGNWWVVLSK